MVEFQKVIMPMCRERILALSSGIGDGAGELGAICWFCGTISQFLGCFFLGSLCGDG